MSFSFGEAISIGLSLFILAKLYAKDEQYASAVLYAIFFLHFLWNCNLENLKGVNPLLPRQC